ASTPGATASASPFSVEPFSTSPPARAGLGLTSPADNRHEAPGTGPGRRARPLAPAARTPRPGASLAVRGRESPMLILTPRVNEEIHIGDGISVTVVAIRGKQVRVGIKAPAHVSIRREELPVLPRPAPRPENGARPA